jgi:glycerate dehydrogenase
LRFFNSKQLRIFSKNLSTSNIQINQMNIIVTDGYTLNPGDLSWHEIATLGALTVFDRTPVELIAERCKHANIILTNKVPIRKDVIDQLPDLKMISVLATGYNVIDTAKANERNIIVCNVPAYGTASVAQHAFALLLELTNHVGLHAQSTANGEWQDAADWSYTKLPLTELSGKTFGLVGLGNIGQRTAEIARSFGMKVLYYTPSGKASPLGTACDLKTVFSSSDIVSLHCPLNPDNVGFVGRELLHLMRPTAFLINTARGQLINEKDLADALNEGRIAGAGLDVLSAEPPAEDNPLLNAKNCIVTPHNAWMSKEARQRIMDITAKNIEAFLNKRPQNVVR